MASLAAAAILTGCTTDEGQKITFFSLLNTGGSGLDGPASLPPPGYDSEFWIDSRGCSFVRTGRAENPWVPQVNNSRQPICDPDLALDTDDAPPSEPPMIGTIIGPTATPGVGTVIDPVTGLKTEIIPPQPIPPSFVQVARFSETANGLVVRKQFADLGFPIVGADVNPPAGTAMSVVLGPFTVQSALDDALNVAKDRGFSDAFTFRN